MSSWAVIDDRPNAARPRRTWPGGTPPAPPALSRAGWLESVCCRCNVHMGWKPDPSGVGGVSHGYCRPCYEADLAPQLAAIRARKAAAP